jgi:multiple sugar transport system substrate-binding protein
MQSRYLKRRDILKLLGTATAASILVTACGGGAPASPTAAPAAPAAAAPAAPAAPTATSAPAAAAPAAPAAATATTAPAPAATPTTAPAAASAGGPTPTPNPLADVPIKPGKPVVEWWFGWGGMTALHALGGVATAFNKGHDDFQVKPLQVSDITTKLLAAIAGGNPPAVETGNINFAQFWVTGAAQPLDDYVKASKVINKDDFFADNLAAGQWKGKTYGVPAVECFLRWALCFNQSFLDKAGIKAEQLPSDFDSLYAFSKATTVVDPSGAIKTLGIDMLDTMGGSFGDGDPFFWPAAYDFKYFDDTTLKYNFNNDQFIAAMAMIQKFYDITGAEKIAGFTKAYGTWTESPTAMLPSGVEGANINGYWAPGELAKSSPNNKFVYGWVPTAKAGTKLQATGGHYGMLPKGGPDPDKAFQFIEYLTQDEALNTIFEGTGWLGARKSYLAKVDASKYSGLDFYIKSGDAASSMKGVIVDPVQAFVSDQWSKLQESVNYHKMTPKDAAAELQKQADTEMKNRFPNGV